MRMFATVRVALRALLVHKGRSFLTSLGIIIGIGAVIAMVSAGDGVQQKLDESMESVGKNLIVVRPGARSQSGVVTDTTPLTRDDAALVRKQAGPFLKGVAEVQLDAPPRRLPRRRVVHARQRHGVRTCRPSATGRPRPAASSRRGDR